jgi:RNA polymerase sigma-70 factor, ECF subfamily
VERAVEREICLRYANRIRAYGLRHLRDAAAAQELMQQVLLAVLSALREGRVKEPERLDAYVLGTCRNTVMDLRRAEARQRRLAEETSAMLPDAYEPEWVGLDRIRLTQCLGSLEPRERAVVLATFIEDRDADEIGKTLSLSPGNVRVIRHRALSRLQTCMGGGGA